MSDYWAEKITIAEAGTNRRWLLEGEMLNPEESETRSPTAREAEAVAEARNATICVNVRDRARR